MINPPPPPPTKRGDENTYNFFFVADIHVPVWAPFELASIPQRRGVASIRCYSSVAQ